MTEIQSHDVPKFCRAVNTVTAFRLTAYVAASCLELCFGPELPTAAVAAAGQHRHFQLHPTS